jgi:hypothetical protein
VGHVEYCIAIELLCACQAIEFLRPLTTTKPLEAVHAVVRSVVKPWDKDRFMSPDIEAVVQLLRYHVSQTHLLASLSDHLHNRILSVSYSEDKIWEAVAPFVNPEFH